jgi:hypothetical protein
MHRISPIFPHHLPGKLKEYRDKYAHHLLLKMSGNGIRDAQPFLESIFSSSQGDFFECPNDEGEKAFLHRFVAVGAGVRYRAIQRREVEDIVVLDVALRRNAAHGQYVRYRTLLLPRVCNWSRADRHGSIYSRIAVRVIPFLMLLYLVTLTGSNKLNLAE